MMRLISFILIFSMTWISSHALSQPTDEPINNKGTEMMLWRPFAALANLFSSKQINASSKQREQPQPEKFFKEAELIKLSRLAVNQNLSGVKEALASSKIDLNAPGYLWATPTHFAMVWSTPEIITEFVKQGADPLLVAYGYGSPLQTMLTGTQDSVSVKMEKVKAMVFGGVDISSAAFADEINSLTVGTLDQEVSDALLKTLVKLGLNMNTRAYDLNLIFGSAHNLEARLDAGAPLFDSGGVGWPLALEIYRLKFSQPQDKSTERLLEKLQAKGVTVKALEERYGQQPSWKKFLPDQARQRPDQITLSLFTVKGKGIKFPAEMKLPMAITLKLVGQHALASNQGEEYFRQLLSNLKLSQHTWYEKPRTLRLNADYLSSLPIEKEKGQWTIMFDAFAAFPEWLDLSRSERDDRIFNLSTGFQQTSAKGENWIRRAEVNFSSNGTSSPVFDRK